MSQLAKFAQDRRRPFREPRFAALQGCILVQATERVAVVGFQAIPEAGRNACYALNEQGRLGGEGGTALQELIDVLRR
jgi:hypothetical protein